MNQGKYIFAQLTDFLPRRVFDRLVDKYEGNKHVRSFTCWNQMLCMMFGQLTARDSMRDLMLSLEAHQPKYYHLALAQRSLAGILVQQMKGVIIESLKSLPMFLLKKRAEAVTVMILRSKLMIMFMRWTLQRSIYV